MITIGERVRAIRKSDKVHMTLDEFGDKLGVRKTAISRIENGVNALTDSMKLSICREFGVNQEWLETGKGEMFVPDPHDEISEIVRKYHLASGMEAVFRQMAQLPDDAQEALLNFIKKTARELTEEAEREKVEGEMSAKTDTSQDNMDTDAESGSGGKILSLEEIRAMPLEEIRALPLEERMKVMDIIPPEELGLSTLVARKNRKDKDNK